MLWVEWWEIYILGVYFFYFIFLISFLCSTINISLLSLSACVWVEFLRLHKVSLATDLSTISYTFCLSWLVFTGNTEVFNEVWWRLLFLPTKNGYLEYLRIQENWIWKQCCGKSYIRILSIPQFCQSLFSWLLIYCKRREDAQIQT